MSRKREIKNHVELLQKGNRGLYGLSLLVGVITGVIVSIYRYGLGVAGNLREHYISRELLTNPSKLLLIWGIFIVIGLFVDYLSRKFPTTGGSGIPQVKALILRKLDYIFWIKELLVKFFGGLLGIGAGLSLGREGPSVQLGSYIGYGFTKIFKRNYTDEKYLVTAGSSAGLAGAFGAPLAGVVFSMEELHRFFSSKLIICTFLASICSNFVARRIFGMDPSFNLNIKYPTDVNPYFQFLFFIVFGIVIAFFGKLFTVSLIKTQDIFKDIKLPRAIKISSVMTLSFIICFIMPDITGGGHHLVEELPHLNQTILFLLLVFVVKLLFTTISYATGFQGGIFLPMLVLGAILGKIYALTLITTFNLHSDFVIHYMILGMAGFFVAVVRAPITGVILILEMTGSFDHLLAIATVSIVAYYITDILKLEPIYEILYERMPKKKIEDDLEEDRHEHHEKTLICIPVSAESEFDEKLIRDVAWPKNTLVVAIRRGETEYIPKGSSKILAGDVLVLLLPEKQADKLNETLFKMGTSH
ncbi:ClC family H(+)/Cl(-) exchange transporter [uncultured Cetobacterium sp.]|uniref:ClC family H(+)/Cl(-) exchange transporter n=1 Tax=uncultured Cetobacterium sp. TaxID=527638 RepID=UPI0026188E0D|nr:ClC family H(+)/Cl(-) exchange transporter [uncultured Cetobacterium sp.]